MTAVRCAELRRVHFEPSALAAANELKLSAFTSERARPAGSDERVRCDVEHTTDTAARQPSPTWTKREPRVMDGGTQFRPDLRCDMKRSAQPLRSWSSSSASVLPPLSHRGGATRCSVLASTASRATQLCDCVPTAAVSTMRVIVVVPRRITQATAAYPSSAQGHVQEQPEALSICASSCLSLLRLALCLEHLLHDLLLLHQERANDALTDALGAARATVCARDRLLSTRDARVLLRPELRNPLKPDFAIAAHHALRLLLQVLHGELATRRLHLADLVRLGVERLPPPVCDTLRHGDVTGNGLSHEPAEEA
eukprot:CAMPEP_0119413624 /NCGR_PEP_ID=MMETSP1335-20130426/5645_1 /TAXON_ID=259385 /ORGANISM="Chrysoculter rhomboideus, Strain RCC1486" /LENGTH=310 /DNA_ID=CAMNT_0007438425 /DNA_START=42 /DNA_END=975 /DNA_ORIENTATION=-